MAAGLSRNQTKTLLGIETYQAEIGNLAPNSRNQTKTLLGIETLMSDRTKSMSSQPQSN